MTRRLQAVGDAWHVSTFNILNEATITGTPDQCWSALIAAFEGIDAWWAPYLVGRRIGDVRAGQVGSMLDLRANARGEHGGFRDRAHWVARVIDADPGRRLVLEYIKGDLRGTSRWLLEPMGAGKTHMSVRFMGDSAGALRWLGPFVNIPAGHRLVVEEGMRRMERYLQSEPMAA